MVSDSEGFALSSALSLLQRYAASHSPEYLMSLLPSDARISHGLRYHAIREDAWLNRERAELCTSTGALVELELIEIIENVRPHFHTRTGGVVLRLPHTSHTSSNLSATLTHGREHDVRSLSANLTPGTFLIVPAETIHSFSVSKARHPHDRVFLLSANTPPMDDADVVYV